LFVTLLEKASDRQISSFAKCHICAKNIFFYEIVTEMSHESHKNCVKFSPQTKIYYLVLQCLFTKSQKIHNIINTKIISDQGTISATNEIEISAVLETAILIQEEGILSMGSD
jgi:hypothetical protein